MFEINEDKTINITRGDIGAFTVDALNEAGEKYLFQKGDVVRIKVTEKKACENVMFQKDFVVEEETEQVEILLTEEETKIGEVISKPTDYWYEVELNPLTNPQTIIGYDEDGAKILRLYPEGNDIEPVEPTPEDIPVVDEELDITSERPVQNQAITRAMLNLQEEIERVEDTKNISSEDLEPLAVGIEENKGNIAKNKGNIEDLTDTLDTHTADKNNPHNVTAEQVSIDGYSSDNMQGAIDELKGTVGYSKKQLIPYPYDALTTANGMTFTDLGDGRIKVNGSNPNGTSSYYLHYANSKYKPNFNNSKVTLSLKSVSGQASVFFRLWGEGGTYIKEYDFAIDKKNGSLTIDMPNETDYSYATIELFYYQGSTVTNDIVEIMIRYASIEDDTYEPYVPSVNGDFGVWTPNAKEAPADRNYYIKTKNMLHIWFTLIPNVPLTNSAQSYNACLDVKKTFGIKSFKDAFAYAYASNFAPVKVFASSAGNVIAFQYSGTEVSTAYAIYGQITLYIE